MLKTIAGIFLIIAGCLLLVMILFSGALFPHILGPITLLFIGTILLALKWRGDKSDKKRIILVIVLIAVVVLIGILLKVYVPSLMQTIIDMHHGL